MVIGNKCDLEEESRAIQRAQAEEYCEKNGGLEFLETSARDNKNVEEAFYKLATKALKRQQEMQKLMDENQEAQRALEREKNRRLGKPNRRDD